jgi:hypothetical protein
MFVGSAVGFHLIGLRFDFLFAKSNERVNQAWIANRR